MYRTTVMLPEDLKFQVARVAADMGMSLGAFIRESLVERIRSFSRVKRKAKTDSFLDDERIFKAEGPRDLSLRHDDYLYGKS